LTLPPRLLPINNAVYNFDGEARAQRGLAVKHYKHKRKRQTRCTICCHSQRASIEVSLVYGMSVRDIGRRFDCSPDAVSRHSRSHLTKAMRAAVLFGRKPDDVALEQLQRTEAEGILTALIAHRARHQIYVDHAMAAGDTYHAIAADRAVLANLELTAKLLGQLITRHEVRSTAILISADYLKLRAAITAALRPFPDAAAAVASALATIEAEAAADIKASRPLLLAEASA
jgi:hypothetical protein